jgi:hypothetical protein
MANRFIFLLVRRSKMLPHGGGKPDFTVLMPELAKSLDFARDTKLVTMDDDAAEHWTEVYPALTADVPGLFGAVTARAAPQVMRLALLYALVDRQPVISMQHLEPALALWRYSEASARRIFGDAMGDHIADTILTALRARTPDGMARTDIHGLFDRNVSAARLSGALGKLLAAGKATRHTITTGEPGRRPEMWVAT